MLTTADTLYMSLSERKSTILVQTWSDTNRSVQSLIKAKSLKFRIKEEEGSYYL